MRVPSCSIEVREVRAPDRDGGYYTHFVSILPEVPGYSGILAILRTKQKLARGRYLLHNVFVESKLRKRDDGEWKSYLAILTIPQSEIEAL